MTIEPTPESTVLGSVGPLPQAPSRMYFKYTREPSDHLALMATSFGAGMAARRGKRRLGQLIPSVPTWLLYVDHVQARGRDFFEVACAHDLEGIVAKPASGRYHADGTGINWIKIKNPVTRR